MISSSQESLHHIDRLGLFAGLSAREKATLSTVFLPRTLKAGNVVCREGDPGHSFYITVQGIIEVHKELAGGRSTLLSRVGPDNLLGQVALIDREPRSATLQAATTALLLECSVDDFDRLFWAGTPFAYKLLDRIVVQLAQRLRDADRQLYDLFSNPQDTLLKLHEAALDIQRTANDRDLAAH